MHECEFVEIKEEESHYYTEAQIKNKHQLVMLVFSKYN